MEWLRKNLSLIVLGLSIFSAAVTAQVQIEANQRSSQANGEAISAVKQEAIERDEKIEKEAQKEREELEKEQRRLEREQQKQTEIRVNQTHIIKGLEAMQESIKELARELREKK